MTPRYYSIASCMAVVGKRADLIVTLSQYCDAFNDRIPGVCSDYLCHRVNRGDEITLNLHPSRDFTLPKKKNLPIIMVGPGTGIAPFRGFMQQRVQQKEKKNWLFFGERHEKSDFYYQDELENWQQGGFLQLTCAFSRDQEKKLYVQHRLLERGKELLFWLEQGGLFFVCGEAKNMAKGVEHALCEIYATYKDVSFEQGRNWVVQLRKQKRYLVDVY